MTIIKGDKTMKPSIDLPGEVHDELRRRRVRTKSDAAAVLARETGQPEADCLTIITDEFSAMAGKESPQEILCKIVVWIERADEWIPMTPSFIASHRQAVIWARHVAAQRAESGGE